MAAALRDEAEVARLLSLLRHLPMPRHAIDLGCGAAQDELIYRAAWPDALIVGLDSDRLAGLGWRQVLRGDERFFFVRGDAAWPPFSPCFDVVLIRHPDLNRRTRAWKQALQAAAGLLTKAGVLLITAYSLPEIERARRWLDPETALTHIALDEATLAPVGLSGRDRYALAYRRR
jgi:SAM-dependent methyltransferase